MKTSRLIMLAFLSVSLVFLSSCEDDPEVEVSPYIGDYIITKATLSEDLVLQTNEIGPLTVMAGTDITTMITTALLGAIDCEPANSLIELREDFSLYLSCTSSMEELDAGTWEEQSATVIVLSMNSTAIPSSPSGIVLTITNVSLIGTALTGTTTVPISEEMLVGIVALMSQGNATLDQEATPSVVPITFTIELTKQ
ncbi:MAG: hypothetical protein KAI08_18205 [Bacteroidales bacterium]|nr:hypothetical protein [Bacteroidales bacterium]